MAKFQILNILVVYSIIYYDYYSKIEATLQPVDIVVEPKVSFNWTSQTFIIPVLPIDELPTVWSNCRQLSQFYCLHSFETHYETNMLAVTSYHNQSSTDITFLNRLEMNAYKKCTAKLSLIFTRHNHFADLGFCCFRQCRRYFTLGYRQMSLSIDDYVSKLTNYSEENKTLNALWAFFDPVCQVNVITKVGFGTGSLSRFSHSVGVLAQQKDKLYSLKVGASWTPLFPYRDPGYFLTYQWFKRNVICRSQAWICNN